MNRWVMEVSDVIVGMDWLSQNKAVIVCHEKVVEIPLEGSGILRVQGERTLGAAKALMNAKVDEPKLSDISVVRDFVDVFPEDLSGLPPQRQVEFRIDLVPGATPVAKSPYRLAPSEMQELSGQLQELQDKGFIRPSHSPDILIYSKTKEDHEVYLRLVLELLRKEKLYAKFSKCEFLGCKKSIFLGHVINQSGIHIDPSKIEAVKNWKAPTTSFEIRSFLGLAVEILRWIELFSDYKCEIRYHPGKANVVADALSKKEQVKPKHVRVMAMTIQSGVKGMILTAQGEAFNHENVLAERLHGLDQQMERKGDESLYFMDRIWVPLVGGVRTVIMDEAHKSRYSVHPGADKMYYDLRDITVAVNERDIATYVSRMFNCVQGNSRVKKYEELSAIEKLQADCDLRAANLVLQGFPPDVYSLINHHRVAKDIWDIVKLLIQGTSLTKQEL
ncbi:hypothetical protein Tco_0499505 [Tanacetum coccineum]